MTNSRSGPNQPDDLDADADADDFDATDPDATDLDASLSPEGMLQLVRDQQREVERKQLSPVPWMLAVWGVAWTAGFLLLWSAWPGGNPWFSVSGVVAGTTFAVLIAVAIAVSAVLGIRIGRGVKGTSNFAGAVYGISWSLCGAAFSAVGVALMRNGMSGELASLFFPSAFALMAGTLYLAGAALWREVSQLVLGIMLLVVGAVSPFFGNPTNNLVLAVLGGGTFLVMAVLAAMKQRRRGERNG